MSRFGVGAFFLLLVSAAGLMLQKKSTLSKDGHRGVSGGFTSFGIEDNQIPCKQVSLTPYTGDTPSGTSENQYTKAEEVGCSQRPGGYVYTDVILHGDFVVTFLSESGNDGYNMIAFHRADYKEYTHTRLTGDGGFATAAQWGAYQHGGWDIYDGVGVTGDGNGDSNGGFDSGRSYISFVREAGTLKLYDSRDAPGDSDVASVMTLRYTYKDTYEDPVRLGFFIHDKNDWLEVYSPGTAASYVRPEIRDSGHGRGDPHLMNVKGEAFDVMKTGNMLLLETPRGGTTETLNLAVRADIDRLGVVACGPTYITNVYMTGHWLGAPVEINSGRIVKTGGSRGFGIRLGKQWQSQADFGTVHNGGMKWSNDTTIKTATRKFIMKVGVLDIVVKQPNRPRIFLDIQIKGISKINAEVGGLLGVDDHAEVEELPSECKATATASLMEVNQQEVLD